MCAKYIDILSDFGFKRIFGRKELMVNFLNALFEKEGKVIKSLRYINKEMLGSSKSERTIIYDVMCEISGGGKIIVEMQRKPQDTFADRALFYMSRSIASQGNDKLVGKGKENDSPGKRKPRWNYRLVPVYGIFITDFHLKDVHLQSKDVVSEYVMQDRIMGNILTDKFKMYFIDLKSFKKTNEDNLETSLEKWIFSIRNMGNMEKTPRLASDRDFSLLYDLADFANMTTRQRNQYFLSVKREWDIESDRQTTRNMIKREKTKAREEGLAEGRAEIARNLISKGLMSDEDVASICSLSMEEVSLIRRDM